MPHRKYEISTLAVDEFVVTFTSASVSSDLKALYKSVIIIIWYSEEGPGWAAALPSSILAVPYLTACPSTASVPITVLLYDGPLLCGFNVAIKRFISTVDIMPFRHTWTSH